MQNSFLQWFAKKFLDRTLQPRELLTARKLIYTALILVLFTGSFFWRRNLVEARASALAVREQDRGDLELGRDVIRLTLTGFRGAVTCGLWANTIEKQKKNQLNELQFQVRWLTRLQPYFITPWLFQSWNLAYNVPVEMDRVPDKYFYITEGIKLLAEGERMNHDNPDVRFNIGFYIQHKINVSDETNMHRSLFQLSCIPPNQRDPARFRVGTSEEFNWEEFERFCKEHPQLVRRLRTGLRKETGWEMRLQFICDRPQAVVQFLRDNWRVPSLYQEVDMTPKDSPWQKDRPDVKRPLEERFPVLPPKRDVQPPQRLFEPMHDMRELTDAADLGDEVGCLPVARSWYSYSQEPVPEPDDLPGYSKEPVDRTKQRRPRYMTTLIFRQYPALIQTHFSDALQLEGWFDETPWVIPGWFQARGNRFADGALARLSLPLEFTSEKAWRDAVQMWQKHGETNHVLFRNTTEEINMREQAQRYWRSKGLPPGTAPPLPTNVDPRLPALEKERLQRNEYRQLLADMPPEEREAYHAARFMFEYQQYRTLTNFHHQYIRAHVETEKPTVTARRLMFDAEGKRLEGSPDSALDLFIGKTDDKGRTIKEGAIQAWLDVLLSNRRYHREFRDDSFTQEQTYDIELRYLELFFKGRFGKDQLNLKEAITNYLTWMAFAGQLNRQASGLPVPDCLGLAYANYRSPPGAIALTTFKGPFDLQLFDIKQRPAAVASALGLLCDPLAPQPLLAAAYANDMSRLFQEETGQPEGDAEVVSVLAVGRTKPLLDPVNMQTVQIRRGLQPTKSSPGKAAAEAKKGPR
jgi:hypothetical protein